MKHAIVLILLVFFISCTQTNSKSSNGVSLDLEGTISLTSYQSYLQAQNLSTDSIITRNDIYEAQTSLDTSITFPVGIPTPDNIPESSSADIAILALVADSDGDYVSASFVNTDGSFDITSTEQIFQLKFAVLKQTTGSSYKSIKTLETIQTELAGISILKIEGGEFIQSEETSESIDFGAISFGETSASTSSNLSELYDFLDFLESLSEDDDAEGDPNIHWEASTSLQFLGNFDSSADYYTHEQFDPDTQRLTVYGGTLTFIEDGIKDGALTFSGSTFLSFAPHPHWDPITGFTTAAWIYPTKTDEGTITGEAMYSAGAFTTMTSYFGLDNGKLIFKIGNSSSSATITSDSTIQANTWTHVMATYNSDDGFLALTINGTIDKTSTEVVTPELNSEYYTTFTIGCVELPTGLCFEGYMDEVRFYTMEHFESELSGLYEIYE
ncbi:MAG: LamG domain-containing protein [Pseudomonadota bacterium]